MLPKQRPSSTLPGALGLATRGVAIDARPVEPGTTGSRPADTEPFHRPAWQWAVLWVYLVGPVVALVGAAVLAMGYGLGPSWLDLGLAVVFYAFTGHGVTLGFHRLFTHKSFRAKRWLRVVLAIAGSMSVQNTVINWVADHRRHHANSDKDGDPHSPWRFGTSPLAVGKGLVWAHFGWLFSDEQTNVQRFAPDLLADPDMVRISRLFLLWVLATLGLPALIGGLATMSWSGALTAFLWAGLVRMLLLHHVTWSINSICHVAGQHPFVSRDRAGNVSALAILSMGESWHNLHHCDPTCARHGVDRGQLDSTARLLRWLELAGAATAVRWPDRERLDRKRVRQDPAVTASPPTAVG